MGKAGAVGDHWLRDERAESWDRRIPLRLAPSTAVRRLVDRASVAPEIVFLSRHGINRFYDPGCRRVMSYDAPLLDGYSHSSLANRSAARSIVHPLGLCSPALINLPRRPSYDIILGAGMGSPLWLDRLWWSRRWSNPVHGPGEA